MIFDLQKASLAKRLAAFIFDAIIFCVIVAGLGVLMSLIVGYDGKLVALENKYLEYEEKYGIDIDISYEDYQKLTEEEEAKYIAAEEAIENDAEINKLFSMIISLSLIIISSSLLLAFIILEMFVPMFLKNGQTLGKKIFGIALMRTDGVRVSNFQIFVRAILGKFTIETMVPVLLILTLLFGIMGIVAIIVIMLLLVLEIVVMIVSGNNSMIHDLLAVTVAVDINSQMIFENSAQMLEYKKEYARQMAEDKPY